MKKILTLLYIFLSIVSYSQSDVQINPNLSFCGESNLAVNPINGHMAVGWMKVTGVAPLIISLAISTSTDEGTTWSTPVYMPHFFKTGTSADPTLAYNKSGELFLVYIDSKIVKDSGNIYCCKSLDDGKTWNKPSKVVDFYHAPDIPIDRPFVVIDKSNGVHAGRLYITCKSYSAGQKPHRIWTTFSDNDGVNWSSAQVLDTLGVPLEYNSNTAGFPCVTSNGKFMVMYPSYNAKFSIYPRFTIGGK